MTPTEPMQVHSSCIAKRMQVHSSCSRQCTCKCMTFAMPRRRRRRSTNYRLSQKSLLKKLKFSQHCMKVSFSRARTRGGRVHAMPGKIFEAVA